MTSYVSFATIVGDYWDHNVRPHVSEFPEFILSDQREKFIDLIIANPDTHLTITDWASRQIVVEFDQ